MQCCKAMEHAIDNQYLEQLRGYTDDKQPISLGIGIPKPGQPIFKFNLCPWCGANVRSEQEKELSDG